MAADIHRQENHSSDVAVIQPDAAGKWAHRKFAILVIGAILIALSLVTVSMIIYTQSGTAQLDLSRPGYSDVRDQVAGRDNSLANFPATGSINQEVIKEFLELYDERVERVDNDAFTSGPLEDMIVTP